MSQQPPPAAAKKSSNKWLKRLITIAIILGLTPDIYVDRQIQWGQWIPGRILLIAIEFDYFRGFGRNER
jgi:hypothetical protein